jgi:teichoic acid transport system permease protein
VSGVFFSIDYYAGGLGAVLLGYQPYALAIDVIRGPLLAEFAVSWMHMAAMAVWAIVAIVVGLVYFWRGEGKYGVD